MARWLVLTIFLACISCREKSLQRPADSFSLDSMLDLQVNYLSKNGASLIKVSSINSNGFTSSLDSKHIDWENELESFRAISLVHKPVYADSYDIKIMPDDKSNLFVKTWVARDKQPIQSLKVYFLNPNQIKRLEATLEQTNFVFTSRKNLTLEFSILGAKTLPERYEISGYQKLFWEEAQDYKLACEIRTK